MKEPLKCSDFLLTVALHMMLGNIWLQKKKYNRQTNILFEHSSVLHEGHVCIFASCMFFYFFIIRSMHCLLELMVTWRIFNIHGIFPVHKKLCKVEKSSLDYLNALYTKENGSFKTCSSMASLHKTSFGTFMFNSTLKRKPKQMHPAKIKLWRLSYKVWVLARHVNVSEWSV